VSGLVHIRRAGGREFQIVAAATLKLQAPNEVLTNGTYICPAFTCIFQFIHFPDVFSTGHRLLDRVVPGTVERGDFPVGGRHRATVRQHPGNRAVPEAVSAQPRASCRAGSAGRRQFRRCGTLQGLNPLMHKVAKMVI